MVSVEDLPTLVKNNKLLIVDAYKEGDECNYVSYDRIKYVKGCAKPFFTDSIEWTNYKSFMNAKASGRLCVQAFQMSGYTQVDKVPAAKISEESAKRLLAQIKRTLTLYSDKIGYSYADYVAYEQKKEVTQLRELILLRTSFLKSCIKKIKS
jgi:hypothetical protein